MKPLSTITLIIIFIITAFACAILAFLNQPAMMIACLVCLECFMALALFASRRSVPLRTNLLYYLSIGIGVRGILDAVFYMTNGYQIDFTHHPLYLQLNLLAIALLMLALIEGSSYNFNDWEHRRISVEIIKSSLVLTPLFMAVFDIEFYILGIDTNLFNYLIQLCYTAILISCFILVCLNIYTQKIWANHGAQIGFFCFYIFILLDHLAFTLSNAKIIDNFYYVSAILRFIALLGIFASSVHRFTLHARGLRFERIDYVKTGYQEHAITLFTIIAIVVFKMFNLITIPMMINSALLFIAVELLDIASRRSTENDARLIKKLSVDDLTGLHNRTYLIEELDYRISKDNGCFTLFFIDLNRFKTINDIHGHHIGDMVLTEIGKRFSSLNEQNLFIARLGGDEFACLLDGIHQQTIQTTVEQIIAIIEQKINVNLHQFYITASIGIARYPTDARETNDLLKYADIAMYTAKQSDTSVYVVHSKTIAKTIERNNQIEVLLRGTDYEKHLELHYQPQFDLVNGQLTGVEALLRWRNDDGSYISPSKFIPIAEECGVIKKITLWVMQASLQQIKLWNSQFKHDIKMNINVSPLDLYDPDFCKRLADMLTHYDVPATWFGIEITERVSVVSSKYMKDMLNAIGEMGVLIAIDDFGTGYSSLSYLKEFNIGEIKIARELIENLETDHNAYMIVRAIISMAKSLGLTTLAEGLESHGQYQILKTLGCDYTQGHYNDIPLTNRQFEKKYLNDNSKIDSLFQEVIS